MLFALIRFRSWRYAKLSAEVLRSIELHRVKIEHHLGGEYAEPKLVHLTVFKDPVRGDPDRKRVRPPLTHSQISSSSSPSLTRFIRLCPHTSSSTFLLLAYARLPHHTHIPGRGQLSHVGTLGMGRGCRRRVCQRYAFFCLIFSDTSISFVLCAFRMCCAYSWVVRLYTRLSPHIFFDNKQRLGSSNNRTFPPTKLDWVGSRTISRTFPTNT